jgi:DNA-binding response OmpR family regulator
MTRDGRGAFITPGRVLVVDDDDQMRRMLRSIYGRDGWKVLEAADGQQALRVLYEHRPDIVVLDVGMEGVDGWETLARIRDIAEVPVLMLTGYHGELDKVRALRGGADDYVTKPFGSQELLARTEAVLRRARARSDHHSDFYQDGLIGIDFQTRLVTVEGQEVHLTPLEFRLLSAFVRHPNHVLSATQLLELAWDNAVGTRDQVKVYVGYLRRKLGAVGARVETVRGFGYRYRPVEVASPRGAA